MTYVLANAVQQLDAENATLRAKLDDAEARLQALEAFALAVNPAWAFRFSNPTRADGAARIGPDRTGRAVGPAPLLYPAIR